MSAGSVQAVQGASVLDFRPLRTVGAGPTRRTGRFDTPTRRSLIATWRRRIDLRRDLARLSKESPHLIEDIGLTMAEVAAEIEKPFWRA